MLRSKARWFADRQARVGLMVSLIKMCRRRTRYFRYSPRISPCVVGRSPAIMAAARRCPKFPQEKMMRVLLLTAIAVVFCGGAFAQAPPIKMGLWEKNMTTDNGDGSPAILKSKSCVTPAEWQEMEKSFTKQREGCSIQTSKTAKVYTFNGTCNIGETQLVINGSTSIPDAEHIVSESHS